jgi:cysteine desulfurase
MMRPHPGLLGGPIYLDYNATTPVDPAVVEAALPYLQAHFGNPSSTHAYADRPRQAVTAARQRLADLLGCTPDEVVFTGSGSEADTLAIHGVALALRGRGDHIITQATEHPAVLNACHALAERHGFHLTTLPVDHHGQLDPATLEAAITPRTVLVTIQHANSETGTLQPIRELAEVAHAHGALVHADAAQSAGKVPVAVDELGVDLLTVVGHKLYAPKGVGALYVRDGVPLEPVILGGGQERGLRAGTENVALIVALGVAVAIAAEWLGAEQPRLRSLRDRLHQRLAERLPGAVRHNGHPTQRLPNTLNVSIDGVIGQQLLAATPQLAASTGAACHAADPEPSGVLLAMGLARERALGALRLTLGRWTTQPEVDTAAELLAAAATGLRHRPTAQHADGRPDEPARTVSTEHLNTLVGG